MILLHNYDRTKEKDEKYWINENTHTRIRTHLTKKELTKMGINLHLLAHRSYPYIDNLHIYVVKCRQKQKSAFVRRASKNGEAKVCGERTRKTANAFANKTECEKRNKQTEILSSRQNLHLNSSFPHAYSFTLQCNECARYIIANAD